MVKSINKNLQARKQQIVLPIKNRKGHLIVFSTTNINVVTINNMLNIRLMCALSKARMKIQN